MIENNIEQNLRKHLDSGGVFYRIFSRVKQESSVRRKLKSKEEKYKEQHKKMQDIVGIRIVFYFKDDVETFHQFLKKRDNYIDASNSMLDIMQDNKENADKHFAPERLNLVFRMNEEDTKSLHDYISYLNSDEETLIDNTYEVQLRTVLSEGWHEVEHDLRYKCKEGWQPYEVESRFLNGILATLETSEMAMIQMIDNLAYKNYKAKEWDSMLRNKFCMRLKGSGLKDELKRILNGNVNTAKQIFRIEKPLLRNILFENQLTYELTYDNLLFLLNRMIEMPSVSIKAIESDIIKDKLNHMEKAFRC